MANAIAGVGTTFERWSGSAWQFIAEINAIEGPTMNKENIEVTALDTDGGYDEFITGFMEGGTLTLNMNFTRSEYELMKQDFEIDVARDYRITLPDDEDTTLEFEGLVIEIPLTMEAEDKLTVDVTIQVTGEVALASAGGGWTQQYKELYATLDVKPSLAVANAQNDFIAYLLGANSDSRNVWAKLACIIPYFAGMPSAEDALIWWNNPARKATLSAHAPDYTLLEGFTGDSANSAYIDTTFNPVSDGGTLYTQDNCSVGYWFRNIRPASSGTQFHGIAITGNGTYINPEVSYNTVRVRVNGDLHNFTSTVGTNLLFNINRKNATTINICRDRVLSSDITNNSVALPNATMHNLAANNGTDASLFADDTIGLFYAGDELDQTDMNVMCDAIDNLLFAINSSTALFDYPADGDIIDEEVWTITNPQPLSVEFEQNNAIIMRSLGVSSTAGENNIAAVITMNYGVFAGSLMDIYKPTIYRSLTYSFGTKNIFAIQRFDNINQNLHFRIYNGTSYVYDLDIGEYEFVIFKIKYTPTHALHFYKWSNDAWVLVGSYVATNVTGLVTRISMTSTGYLATETHLRDIYITKKDFNTMIP